MFFKGRNRIRASDKTLVFRTATGFLLLVFLVVLLLLNIGTLFHTDWKSVSLLHEGSFHLTVTPYMIGTVIVAGAVSVAAPFLYRHFLPDKVKPFSHRQKLARMILENGWYEPEKTQDSVFSKTCRTAVPERKSPTFPKCAIVWSMDLSIYRQRSHWGSIKSSSYIWRRSWKSAYIANWYPKSWKTTLWSMCCSMTPLQTVSPLTRYRRRTAA